MKGEPRGALYAICREGTDPAVTRALEKSRDPWNKIAKAASGAIDWDFVDGITQKLLESTQLDEEDEQ